jgi:hypothetical protein
MRQLFAVLSLCFLAVSAHAAELVWDAQPITSPLTVERSATQTGTYTTVATLPTGATSYILTPGAYGWYRVRNSAGPSNVVQFSLDLYTGTVTSRLDALETRVRALEAQAVVQPPVQTSNLTVRQIDADHIEITCNGIGITTSGSGTRRLMECRH